MCFTIDQVEEPEETQVPPELPGTKVSTLFPSESASITE